MEEGRIEEGPDGVVLHHIHWWGGETFQLSQSVRGTFKNAQHNSRGMPAALESVKETF